MSTPREWDKADSTTAAHAATESGDARKVNFFIVGAPKCGTTAWYEYLRSHPHIFFPDLKEPGFFALDLPQSRHVSSDHAYSKLFAGTCAKVIGEASADYLFSECAAEAIRNYNDRAKILILLREQEEFLPSLHNQHLWGFWEEIEDFETAWRLSDRRSPDMVPASCSVPRLLNYAELGRFDEQVGRFLAAFPAGQVLVIRFREWVGDPRAAYLRILDFLELEDDGHQDFPRINEAMRHRSRRLARFLFSPSGTIWKLASLVTRATGHSPQKFLAATEKIVTLLARPGLKKEISPELRDEIRRFYAEDNKLLDERLRGVGMPPQRQREPMLSTRSRRG